MTFWIKQSDIDEIWEGEDEFIGWAGEPGFLQGFWAGFFFKGEAPDGTPYLKMILALGSREEVRIEYIGIDEAAQDCYNLATGEGPEVDSNLFKMAKCLFMNGVWGSEDFAKKHGLRDEVIPYNTLDDPEERIKENIRILKSLGIPEEVINIGKQWIIDNPPPTLQEFLSDFEEFLLREQGYEKMDEDEWWEKSEEEGGSD